MSILNYLIWSPDPVAFSIPLDFLGLPNRPVVWYGILFASGFILSQQIMYWIWEKDGKPKKDIDVLTTHMVVATILGARLGHCLFYNPGFYLSNPIEILKIWEGGLASHGGAIGILIAIWVFVKYEIKVKWFFIIPYKWNIKKQDRPGQSYLWVLDRLVIVVALTGALIRTGNFMNSEMEGKPTNSETGVIYAKATKELLYYNENEVEDIYFKKGAPLESDKKGYEPITVVVKYDERYNADTPANKQFIENQLKRGLRSYGEVTEHIDFGEKGEPLSYELMRRGKSYELEIYGIGVVRHTAQLYEAGYCLIIMIVLFLLWYFKREDLPTGFNFALFNIMLWSLRFVDEFFKMNQEAFEDEIPLNMGQILSIPMFLMGVIVMVYAFKKQNKTEKT